MEGCVEIDYDQIYCAGLHRSSDDRFNYLLRYVLRRSAPEDRSNGNTVDRRPFLGLGLSTR